MATTAAVLAWAVWGTVMVASLVPYPLSLTFLRTLAPLSVPVAIWAAMRSPGLASGAMVALAVAGTAASWSGWVSDTFVDGGSYGDERRFALRVPLTYWAGPIPLFWALCSATLLGGPLLIAAGLPLAGVPVLLVGGLLARRVAPAFHALSRRWLVFVPAGITVVDHHALADPVLLPRSAIASVAPATVDTVATDLTGGAPGLITEIDLSRPIEAAVRAEGAERPRNVADLIALNVLLVAPVRPGAVLGEVVARGTRPSRLR